MNHPSYHDATCPWPYEALLDPSFLRSFGVDPHYFGLGFIPLKLSEEWRIHFWVPEWPTIPGAETELHDHRYGFESRVLLGQLNHQVYATGPVRDTAQPGDVEMALVSCQPGQEQIPVAQGYCQLLPIAYFTVQSGQSYRLPSPHLAGPHGYAPATRGQTEGFCPYPA